MKKLKIFPKTFLYTLGLMLIIVLLSHALIYFLMPHAYNYQQEKALEADANALADKIISATPVERVTCVTDFAAKWNSNVTITYDDFSFTVDLLKAEPGAPPNPNGKSAFTIIADSMEDGLKVSLAENPYGGADFFRVEQAFAGGTGKLTATVSRQHIEDAVGAVLMILPFTAALCVVISVLFALAYSKMFTRQIKQISTTTEQMQTLNPDMCCQTESQDEIGMLAENVNNLYQSLLAALAQQTNFLRAASHELKTPVTAVSAMLENMILNVGKYKDRDTYLAKCKDLTDRLAQMIKEILDASKAEFAMNQECTDFRISDVISTVIEPYQIIAKAKGITMNVTLDETGTVCLPRGMIEKVISNILANAVSYTKPDGIIIVSCSGQKLVVENECTPIPPEHLAHIFEPFYRPEMVPYERDKIPPSQTDWRYLFLNVFRRTILYDTRKPGKSLTLFLLFLLVTVFITMSFSALNAVHSAASRLRETVGASFTLRGKPLELDTDGDDYVMEFSEISPQDIQQIASNSGIRACNAQRTISATADGFIYPSGKLSGPVSGNTESAWNTNFTNGVLTLVEGRHISKEDKSTALVSRELAEENSLQIGSELTFSDPPATVKIVGVYESDPSMEFDTDTIFTDLGTVGNSIERVDFFVTDPAELETVMARIESDNYTLQANTTEYDAISTQLAAIGRLTTVLIVAAIVVGATVLFLILAMRIRGRTHEVGIYLAMGISKRNILAQFLIETSALLLLAMAISCPISCLATVQIGAVLKSMVGTASVTISLWKLLAQYATEMAVITAGVVAATYPAMRLQPKEILSRMS